MNLIWPLLLTTFAWAMPKVELHFPDPRVAQGEIVETILKVDASTMQDLEILKNLRGHTSGKTIYFYEIAPFTKLEGGKDFQAEAKVIFTNLPSTNEIVDTLAGQSMVISWAPLEIVPTEAPAQLIFGQFDVLPKMPSALWPIVSCVGLLVTVILLVPLWKRRRQRRQEKERRLKLKQSILACDSYNDVVKLWRDKHTFFREFPDILGPFQELEVVLNKYQFRPSQTEIEKIEVLDAYRRFKRNVEGGLLGI